MGHIMVGRVWVDLENILASVGGTKRRMDDSKRRIAADRPQTSAHLQPNTKF